MVRQTYKLVDIREEILYNPECIITKMKKDFEEAGLTMHLNHTIDLTLP